ncbi:MAG: hypothetical protein AAF518_15870 [Spirochaetota bacterium]
MKKILWKKLQIWQKSKTRISKRVLRQFSRKAKRKLLTKRASLETVCTAEQISLQKKPK